jgi:hypothetical protein
MGRASMTKGRECLNFEFCMAGFFEREEWKGGGAVAAGGGGVAGRDRTAKNIYFLRRV